MNDTKISQINAIIQKIFLEDEIPWVLGYSGGKDSTAALQVVWNALKALPVESRNKKKVYVVSTNTLIEGWLGISVVMMPKNLLLCITLLTKVLILGFSHLYSL